MSITIRAAHEGDYSGIDQLLKTSFPSPDEARLVRLLRAADANSVELVGAHSHGDHDHIVSHVVLSPVTAITADKIEHQGLGLGPLAVEADARRQGLGGAMVKAALSHIEWLPVPFLVVLGDPSYYSRFDFTPAQNRHWFWDKDQRQSEDLTAAFQVLVRDEDRTPLGRAERPVSVSYHPAFDIFDG